MQENIAEPGGDSGVRHEAAEGKAAPVDFRHAAMADYLGNLDQCPIGEVGLASADVEAGEVHQGLEAGDGDPARVDANGCFVPLADQDPSLWTLT
jgi:hypothetical protein